MANRDDPDHQYGWCCGADYECGDEFDTCRAVCKQPQFECGEYCCDEDAACCPVGDGSPICCPDGQDCVKQITPGNIGITPDSPYVCCPEEQLVTALTVSRICCPEGSVRQPGGGLSTAGGLCCTAGNVCAGRDCCDSTPSFPKECVNGRCEFEFLEIQEKSVKTERDGTVKVPVNMQQAHPATVSVVMAGGSARASAEAAAAAKPVVPGPPQAGGEAGAPDGPHQALAPRPEDAAQAPLAAGARRRRGVRRARQGGDDDARHAAPPLARRFLDILRSPAGVAQSVRAAES